MSQLFASGGQSIGPSASASVLPMDSGLIFFRMDWLNLPKGDQSWVFFGRTDVKAEAPILWPPDAKS